MQNFSYRQCDQLRKKINNFDTLVNNFYSKSNCVKQNMSDQNAYSKNKNNDNNYKLDERKTYKYVKKNNLNSREQQQNNYKPNIKSKYNSYVNQQNNPNKYKKKYFQGYQNTLRDITQVQQQIFNRNKDQYHHTQINKIVNLRSKQDMNQFKNFQSEANHIRNERQKQKSRLEQMKQKIQMEHNFNSNKNEIIKNEYKYQSIDALNDQIKQIMERNNYDFTCQQAQNLIGQKRITLPSCRKKTQFIIQDIDIKQKYGIPKNYNSQLAHEINHSINFNQQQQQNQFSPYSQEQKQTQQFKRFNALNEKQRTHLNKNINIRKISDLAENHTIKQANPRQISNRNHFDISQNQSIVQQIIKVQNKSQSNNILNQQLKVHSGFQNKNPQFNIFDQIVIQPKSFDNFSQSNKDDMKTNNNFLKYNPHLQPKSYQLNAKYDDKNEILNQNYSSLGVNLNKNNQRTKSCLQNYQLGKCWSSHQAKHFGYQGLMELQYSKVDDAFNSQIDKSIQELNQKIKKVEQKKKQLNINFKPFDLEKFKNNIKHKQIIKDQIQQKYSHKINDISISNSNQYKKVNVQKQGLGRFFNNDLNSMLQNKSISYRDNLGQSQKQNYLSLKKIYNTTLSNKSLKLINFNNQKKDKNDKFQNQILVQQNNKKIQKQIKKYSDLNKDIIIQNKQQNVRHQKQYKIGNEKQRSSQKKFNKSVIVYKKVQKTKNQTQKLLIKLIKQIELDQQFRNMKIWFQFYYTKENKWYQLTNVFNSFYLSNRQNHTNKCQRLSQFYCTDNKARDSQLNLIKLRNQRNNIFDIQKIKQIFSINLNEHDPFYPLTTETSQGLVANHKCLDTLILSYFEAQDYWHQHLKCKFNSLQLIRTGFQNNSFDLQQKGYILLQDIVRFINLNVNSMYRNRDLILIYQRIKSGNSSEIYQQTLKQQRKVLFKQILKVFSKQNKI